MIFRFFNVFGEGQDPASPYSGVITVFTKLAREGKPLTCYGGGSQTRDFISVHDIVSGCVSALQVPIEKWVGLPINLGTEKAVTILELANTIARANAHTVDVVKGPEREGDVQHSLASIERAKNMLGFSPNYDLKTGLNELLKMKEKN